jgi:hypothetical protein
MALTNNRTRSPKYPNFPLGAAVRQIGKIHAADRRNVIERMNAAKHMGYSGLSGPAEKAIGTLVQYGLLELVGKGQVRVSQLAVDILHPVNDAERKAALAKAAFKPEIFKALSEQFPDGVSEASLQSYLVRQNFMDRAITPLSKAYAETSAFLEQSGANDSHRHSVRGASESDLPDDDSEDDVVYGGARVGDLIQWESGGALRFENPLRVRWVSDDGQWVAVVGSDTGVPMSEVLVQERIATTPPPVPPEAPPTAQEMARTPGVGSVSAAEIANLPPTGWTQAIFPLADGPVFLNFPEQMSADGYAELKEYLEIFLRRAERTKRQQEGDNANGDGA